MSTRQNTKGTGSSAKSNNNTNINQEHKSRLFSYIFGREETKKRTLSLYNSLSGMNYTNPDDITITTIDDVIYMGMKNDLSYIVTDKVSLYSTLNINEHQSTENPNMPIREFMYAARLYDKYLKMNKKNPYSSTIIPLPIPKLVVLYNGLANVPDETLMRLSDAFKAQIRSNINSGMEIDKAADKALDDMPDDYELKEQLMAHRAEVVGMWINEYNEEETMQMFKEEGIKIGEQRGRQEGENLLATLINKLISLGRTDDISKVTNDPAFRDSLYVQFGFKKTF